MNRLFLLFIFSLILLSISFQNLNAKNNIVFTEEDKILAENMLKSLEKENNKNTAELLVAAGKLLLGKPYVAHTLESEKEQLTINLRELDCTTFAENCLALAITSESEKPDFKTFAHNLQQIRYLNGDIKGYLSRLHYFSDWIYQNHVKERVKSVSAEIANTPYDKHINFMSQNPNSYAQLKNNPELVSQIQKIENNLNERNMFFIPENKIAELEHQLFEGDIVGITTSVKGLDIMHVGILIRKNNRIHLLHASSEFEKVIISEDTLEDYLFNSKAATGIMVARPF